MLPSEDLMISVLNLVKTSEPVADTIRQTLRGLRSERVP